jgi:hypothetical protein
MLGFRLTALACLSSLAALPLVFAAPAPLGGSYCAEVTRLTAGGTYDGLHQELFFSVLEGLYRDGVSSQVVDAVIAADARGAHAEGAPHDCMICVPALDAFRTYRGRPVFAGAKTRADTFGTGLAAAEQSALTGADDAARRKTTQALIERWIGQRMERLRLDNGEREAWRETLAARRKQGVAASESGAGRDKPTCSLCVGTTVARKGS